MVGHRQKGFTLIELAVVLVIIGLLIGGILQLGSIRQAAQAKDVITMAGDISAATTNFKDNYKFLPGDFPAAVNEIPLVAAACLNAGANAGNGDGVISALESACVPEHLFRAGLVRANINPATGLYRFTTPFGPVTVISGALSQAVAAGGILPATTQNVIEFTNLPCEIVLEFDQKMDDGSLTTGNAVAISAAPAIATCVPGSGTDPVPFFDIAL